MGFRNSVGALPASRITAGEQLYTGSPWAAPYPGARLMTVPIVAYGPSPSLLITATIDVDHTSDGVAVAALYVNDVVTLGQMILYDDNPNTRVSLSRTWAVKLRGAGYSNQLGLNIGSNAPGTTVNVWGGGNTGLSWLLIDPMY